MPSFSVCLDGEKSGFTVDKIYFLEEYRFEYYPEERSAILHILNYFYEQTVIKGILDSSEKKLFPFYV